MAEMSLKFGSVVAFFTSGIYSHIMRSFFVKPYHISFGNEERKKFRGEL